MVLFVHFLCDCTKKTNQKKCALPLHDFSLKLSVSRENLQHCISFRVASDSSRFFTLETTQFLNGKNRKAACDFGTTPHISCPRKEHSPRKGEISITPYKAKRSDAAVWGCGKASCARPRHGRQVRKNTSGDAAEERKRG